MRTRLTREIRSRTFYTHFESWCGSIWMWMDVGVLHDVVEDTRYTFEDLRGMGYSEEIWRVGLCDAA